METNEELILKMKQLLHHSTEEERNVIQQVLNGIQQKREGTYNTYIASFMQSTTEYNDNDLHMTIPIQPILHNTVDIVHGGLTATLADTAMGALINRKIKKEQVAVTSEMKLNYTTPATGKFLTCCAKILHLGTKTSVTEAKIYNDNGTLVAVATGSFYIIPR